MNNKYNESSMPHPCVLVLCSPRTNKDIGMEYEIIVALVFIISHTYFVA